MTTNKQTFWDMKNFLINFAMMTEGDDKIKIRESERYKYAMSKAYTIFPYSQRVVIYKEVHGKLEKEVK